MMLRILIFFFILKFYSPVYSSTVEDIKSQMQLTNNLSFDFIQTINDRNENGKCIIKYPKKIWCEYDNINKKTIISDGKSLVIKNKNSSNYYIYPLTKTPLVFLLDKEFLISKMNSLEARVIENKYINYTIFENDNKINIFFDKKNLTLVGWQTEDIYQNLVITFISSIKINKKIDDKIFILPVNN
ncbi:outer membrane lipoprotein-sorting protein [Candidatus Pelagibacter ubique]|uniref:Outer membrane lipoprotein-sorting protein n=1 Tax=Pelagibacter ubique TaxID=198252 RepID=A0ABX1T1G6_PELUQ|nr:outer-membrane lipoprotein carrier protein LolA [Candidatus Pelagibacter ubique]NMN67309.1 outer membrane lipoprotein-sorting protein [Candidatus Pelagibacter ubique]